MYYKISRLCKSTRGKVTHKWQSGLGGFFSFGGRAVGILLGFGCHARLYCYNIFEHDCLKGYYMNKMFQYNRLTMITQKFVNLFQTM